MANGRIIRSRMQADVAEGGNEMAMKKYAYSMMYDKRSTGETRIFDGMDEALEYGKHDWNHMTKTEREDLLWCEVFAIGVTPEQLEDINEGRASADDFRVSTPAWSPLFGVEPVKEAPGRKPKGPRL